MFFGLSKYIRNIPSRSPINREVNKPGDWNYPPGSAGGKYYSKYVKVDVLIYLLHFLPFLSQTRGGLLQLYLFLLWHYLEFFTYHCYFSSLLVIIQTPVDSRKKFRENWSIINISNQNNLVLKYAWHLHHWGFSIQFIIQHLLSTYISEQGKDSF